MARTRAAKLRPYGAPKFALFGEMLLAGVAVTVLSVGIVTAVPALVAGTRHLCRHAEGGADGIGALISDFWFVLRRLWKLGAAVAAVAVFLVVDAWALAALAVPGAAAVTVVLALAGGAAAVVLLRFVGGWREGTRAREQLARAAVESTADPLGSVLLLLAAGSAALVVWMFPPLVIVAGGILSIAAYGVDTRLEHLAAE